MINNSQWRRHLCVILSRCSFYLPSDTPKWFEFLLNFCGVIQIRNRLPKFMKTLWESRKNREICYGKWLIKPAGLYGTGTVGASRPSSIQRYGTSHLNRCFAHDKFCSGEQDDCWTGDTQLSTFPSGWIKGTSFTRPFPPTYDEVGILDTVQIRIFKLGLSPDPPKGM